MPSSTNLDPTGTTNPSSGALETGSPTFPPPVAPVSTGASTNSAIHPPTEGGGPSITEFGESTMRESTTTVSTTSSAAADATEAPFLPPFSFDFDVLVSVFPLETPLGSFDIELYPVRGDAPYAYEWSNGELTNAVANVTSGISVLVRDSLNKTWARTFFGVELVVNVTLMDESGRLVDVRISAPNAMADLNLSGPFFSLRDLSDNQTLVTVGDTFLGFIPFKVSLGGELALSFDLGTMFGPLTDHTYQPSFVLPSIDDSMVQSPARVTVWSYSKPVGGLQAFRGLPFLPTFPPKGLCPLTRLKSASDLAKRAAR